MKKLNLKIAYALALVIPFSLFTSCNESENMNPDNNMITDEVKADFTSLGFDVSDITTTNGMEKLDPSEGGKYLLEGDLIISQSDLQNMLSGNYVEGEPVVEQYRTNNLVSQGRTINVCGYTGNNSNGLDNTMKAALTDAVNNYKALNINLNFTLTFTSNYTPYDIVVYRVSGSAGGSAGFPSGGAPYKFVQILSGTSSYGTNVVEHVMTHEIGHCVGMRHTDYFNRSISCGSGGNEGTAGVGAVHVPGTPTGADMNSIMLSCFGAGEDGEFGPYDRVALEYLY
jgi:hypothetical protein